MMDQVRRRLKRPGSGKGGDSFSLNGEEELIVPDTADALEQIRLALRPRERNVEELLRKKMQRDNCGCFGR